MILKEVITSSDPPVISTDGKSVCSNLGPQLYKARTRAFSAITNKSGISAGVIFQFIFLTKIKTVFV